MAKASQPFNLKLMHVDEFIKQNNLQEVTSPFIHESSSTTFSDGGLFSERIFGPVASQQRLIQLGYISLNCRVFHPVIFQNLISLKRFYGEIMSGRSYAKWDPVEKDLVRASDEEEGADTGYSFFLKYFPLIKFDKNASLRRNDKIDVILKYKDRLLIDKCIVAPAGIRDIKDENERMEKDSINTLYVALLERAKAMPPHADTDPIYDQVHYSIQHKVLEIYEYLLEFVRGKRGFFESRLGARSVAQGTRNVITSANLEASSPSSPQFHRLDEAKIPLYQAAKGYQSLVIYWLKSIFYSSIIQEGADNIPLIDMTSFKLVYDRINDKDKESMLSAEGIMKTIDRFRDVEYRWRPVVVRGTNDKAYYLYLVYDDGKEIYTFRNIEEFKMMYKSGKKKDPDQSKIRPLTYAEMIYIATYQASVNKFGTITRYPVTDENSIIVARTHLASTAPARVVRLITNAETGAFIQLPEYPIIGNNFIDAVMFHPSRRAGLSADYDGDTVSWIPVLSQEANDECEKYVHSKSFYVNPTGKSSIGTDDLVSICLHAFTQDPPKEK